MSTAATCSAIGVMLNNLEPDRLKAFEVAARLGFGVVHTSPVRESRLAGPERQEYCAAARQSGLTIASMFVGFDGQSYADIPTIQRTVGLTIPSLREQRCLVVLEYSELAKELGVASLSAHLGFLPRESTAQYDALIATVRRILDRCAQNGQSFHFETGQESADEMLRLIHAIDRPNLGVNFDVANFILYGSDDPLAALDKLAPLVRGVHCKDGRRPQYPGVLGGEVPIGQGEVDFPRFLAALGRHGYTGPLIIEREHGPNVVGDVLAARDYLHAILN